MTKIFVSPSDYVQGQNILFGAKTFIEKFGQSPILIADNTVYEIIGQRFIEYLESEKFVVNYAAFSGQASADQVTQLTAIAKNTQNDFVIALGGGKTLDTGKAIADNLGIPLVIIPTAASMDAPTSRLSVLYHEDGTFGQYRFYNRSANLILVDTQVIVQAPVKMLKSGISDALATWIEARAVAAGKGKTIFQVRPTLTALAIAQAAEKTLFKYADQAIMDNQAQVVTEAFDAVVEANTLMSGLGFESGGLGAAHPIQNGFLSIPDKAKPASHGDRVAYGALTQLKLEGKTTAEYNRYLDLYLRLGLPTVMADLFTDDVTYDDLLKIGTAATGPYESIHQVPGDPSAAEVAQAMLAVDVYDKLYKQQHGY